MPIILAIEPDRRQAAHVSAVVRHRVGADLILADTTEGALDAIGSRVPDLVLVPALLSPQDDAALAAALRVIAAAAHVRTLTIPVFSSGTNGAQPGGLLARFRRGRSQTTPVGCDPAVFAEQITEYLREAAAERADIESQAETIEAAAPMAIASVAEPPAAEAAEPSSVEQLAPFEQAGAFEQVESVEPHTAVALSYRHPFAPDTPPVPIEFAEPTTALFADHAVADEPAPHDDAADDEIVIDLSDDIVEISPETTSEALFDGEPFGVYTLSLDEKLDPEISEIVHVDAVREVVTRPMADADAELAAFAAALEQVPVAPVVVEARGEVVEARREDETPIDNWPLEPAADPAEEDAWISIELRYTRQWPVLEGFAVESATPVAELVAASTVAIAADSAPVPVVIAESAPPPAVAAPAPAPAAPAPAGRPDHLEWAELVASLRQDIERRRTQPAAAAATTAVAAQPTKTHPRLVTPDEMHVRRSRSSRPVQDEWGFFDPKQCGFAALLAKLDEFSDAPEDSKARPRS